MNSKYKILFIPIDNRPVCYELPKLTASIDDYIELKLPPKEMLGGLKKVANSDALINWLKNEPEADAVILSLDTIAHGGLIPSRRSLESYNEIEHKLIKLKNALKKSNAKVYAFSSVMRISNNNINEEEKEYWSEYGEKIFQYSQNIHKKIAPKHDIPEEILNDYLNTRFRNFEINKLYLKWAEEGIFERLIFSKDDCAEFGLNVQEAQNLVEQIKLHKLKAEVRTGADEIPLTLLGRAISNAYGKVKIAPIFINPESKELISNYEDISIEQSVISQIKAAGCIPVWEKEADLILIINNFERNQGEIVMGIDTKPFQGELNIPDKPYAIADVRFANGADNNFVTDLINKLKESINTNNFYGYSAWNTSANSLGSLICASIIKFKAKEYNENAFKKLQFTRLLDDWAYQANIRQLIKANKNKANEIKELMTPFEIKINKALESDFKPSYYFPWARLFEIEVKID